MREPDEQALSTTFYKLYGGKNLLNTNCNQLKVISYHTYHVCSWKWKMLGSIFVNATLISRNIIDSNWMTTQVPQTLGFKVTPCKWLKIYKNLLFHNNLAKRAENIWEIKISDFDAKGCKKFQSWENIGAAAPIRFALNHYHLMGWWFFVKEIMVLLLISTNRTSWQWIEYFIGAQFVTLLMWYFQIISHKF